MKFNTNHFQSIQNSPCFKLAIQGFLELLENDLTNREQLIQNNQQCFCSFFNQIPISCVVFEIFKDTIWIYLMYTIPKFRNEGIMTKLINKLVKYALDNNIKYIEESTHVQNKKALKFLKNQNFEQINIMHRRTL